MPRSYKQNDIALLYSRSAGHCNYCDKPVFRRTNDGASFINVGDISHNRPYSEDGPRAGSIEGDIYPIDKHSIDNSYKNLILLCKTDHKFVDTDPFYTVEEVQKLKDTHESRIAVKLSQSSTLNNSFDQTLVKTIFRDANLQSILNSLDLTPYQIKDDFATVRDIRTFLEDENSIHYPFKDRQLYQLTQNWFNSFETLYSNIRREDFYTHNPYSHIFHINKLNEAMNLEKNNIIFQSNLFKNNFLAWINYCKSNYDV